MPRPGGASFSTRPGVQFRAAELPQEVALLEAGHADGARRRLHDARQRQRRGLPRPREALEQRLHQVGLLYAACVRYTVRLHQPLEIAHWQAGERLRTCTRSGYAASEAKRGGAPYLQRCRAPEGVWPRRVWPQRGYGGRGGAWRWHRVAAPRSGRAARPRRLRWRGRAIERSRPPLRSRPPPIGCRKESPTLRGTTADGDEVGWGWVRVGVSGRGGGCGTGLKMTKQVLATRELRNKGGRAVSAYDYLRHRGATHLCLQSHPALRVGHRARSVTSTRWQGGRGNSPSSSPFARNRAVLLQPCSGRALVK